MLQHSKFAFGVHNCINEKTETSQKIWQLEGGKFFLCSGIKTPAVALLKNPTAFACRDKSWSFYSEHFILDIQEDRYGGKSMAWLSLHFQLTDWANWLLMHNRTMFLIFSWALLSLFLKGLSQFFPLNQFVAHDRTCVLFPWGWQASLCKGEGGISIIAICSGHLESWLPVFRSSRDFPLNPLHSVLLGSFIPWGTSTCKYIISE